MPRLRAIALTCITAKNREQVGVIEFWGAQQPMVRCVSFLCSASESGVERVLCSPHPKLNPIRPITLDNGAHTRDIDIAIPFRLIWKTRPYIGQPWSSGRIPACQHNGIITQKNCTSTTVRRRVPENMELLAAKVVYSLTILTRAVRRRYVDQPSRCRESRLAVPFVAPTHNSHAGMSY